jgi:Alw26I/Eco31I/Esp3I family type II restriction endonuclease
MAPKQTYGSRGQQWHPDFISYIEMIAAHPNYSGMPDAFTEDGRVQWEAPSNRQSGKYRDTHHHRRDWWRTKAQEVKIAEGSPQWISRTAKLIHPTKKKPCKRCGRVLELAYVYPQDRLLRRFQALPAFDGQFQFQPLEPIDELVTRLVDHHGDGILDELPGVFDGPLPVPNLGRNLRSWLDWLRTTLIPAEPAFLSPGAMSNAPDRFDGFHSFNLCCRGKPDTGRHRSNLSTYVTDRRAFEFWNDGDRIAADCLMGHIRTALRKVDCINGHQGPCSADHTGPLSLGFCHRPEFQLMCRPCNSGKNNRLSRRDVQALLAAQAAGEQVISWHSQAVWEARKLSVVDDETALRLTKLLRDNRRSAMFILGQVAESGYFSFLCTLLHLEKADADVQISESTVDAGTVRATKIIRRPRNTRYSTIQKARRVRIAFDSLSSYTSKERRNSFVVVPAIQGHLTRAERALSAQSAAVRELDRRIASALKSKSDGSLQRLVDAITDADDPAFARAFREIEEAMDAVGTELGKRWAGERYDRTKRT